MTAKDERIATLDLIRGVAVMGIFSVNIIGFAMPQAAYLNPAAYGGATGADLAVWLGNFILVDNKMRSLFSALFGASMLLVADRAEAAGLSAAKVHYRRMAWLLLFGLAHCYFIWSGDILALYALVGMAAFAFRKATVERLLSAAFVFFLMNLALMALLAQSYAAAEAAADVPHASAHALAAWRDAASDLLPPTPEALAANLAIFRGGYGGIVHERLTVEAATPLINLIFAGPDTLSLMLLGMAGLKSGFLRGAWHEDRYRRVALWGIGIGIVGEAAIAGWTIHRGFSPTWVFAGYMPLSSPVRIAMASGYAAAIVLLGRKWGPLAHRIASAGRTAFTNYLGTSLLAAFLFYGYGLGLYGCLGRLETWLFVPLFWALMLAWSAPWLKRFRYGPFEWLWRSLARFKLQPMRKS